MSTFNEGSEMEVDVLDVSNQNLDEVLQIVKKSMEKNEHWYLVDKKWFEQCERFIHDKEPTNDPGPIDNSNLFQSTSAEGLELRDQLQEALDYQFLPEQAWNILVKHFGIPDEKYIIKRPVINESSFSSSCVVEVYPIKLTLCQYGQSSHTVTKHYSRITTLRELEEDMRHIFNVSPSRETQIYQNDTVLNPADQFDALATTVKVNDNQTLAEASLYNGNIITLEVRFLNGSWPSSRSRYGSAVTGSCTNDKSQTPGLCGLMNLGNTCFMNSALQCLSNTPPLTEFITSDKYLDEINKDNPLGMRGEIAKTYGAMIKNMWSGDSRTFSPREFKLTVGRFAPQFSGFAQQDSQELMAFLLDGLHEDLNRIRKKPIIEVKSDVAKRPDHVVAQESWENYKKRNDSIIVDTFHGLLKSTIVCPDCRLISVTFDPFCYLSLPLPIKDDIQIDVIFVPAYGKHKETNGNDLNEINAVKLKRLSIPKYGCISDISNAVAEAVNDENVLDHKIDPSKLLVTDIYNHRIYKIFRNEEEINMNMDDLVIYELFENKLSIPVYLREVKPNNSTVLFGRPFFIGVDDPQIINVIYETVQNQLKRFIQISASNVSSDEGVAECDKEAELMSLSLTNSYGMIDIDALDTSSSIRLDNKSYLAVNFPTATKTNYLDESKLKNFYKLNMPETSSEEITSILLSDCIVNFTATEKLGVNDPWYCPACKKHQQATKKFDLWDLPNVLIIHLKRFSYSHYSRDKLDTFVDFPITSLNMGEYVIDNPDKKPIFYDLIAVSNHYGGLGGGHYTAYAKNNTTQGWYYFNDSSVSAANEESVVSQHAYVLYYLKRT